MEIFIRTLEGYFLHWEFKRKAILLDELLVTTLSSQYYVILSLLLGVGFTWVVSREVVSVDWMLGRPSRLGYIAE